MVLEFWSFGVLEFLVLEFLVLEFLVLEFLVLEFLMRVEMIYGREDRKTEY
jgi:hypothetical protein